MKRPAFRLTFLWRFTLVTLAVSIVAAVILAYSVERSELASIQREVAASTLGRISAQLTTTFEIVARSGKVSPATMSAFAKTRDDATRGEYVTDLRIYRPSGRPIFPSDGPTGTIDVHKALASDDITLVDHGAVITAYQAYFAKNETVFVIAIDLSTDVMASSFDRERQQIVRIVIGVAAIIFFSLVVLAAGASRELERRRRESQSTFVQTLGIMAETIDLRDPYTAGHSKRVSIYSRRLAQALDLSDRECDVIEGAALLHDIGKIGIPDAVLFKPGKLDEAERLMINTHPSIGAKLLSSIASMEDVTPCVLHHHEKLDGTGYPDKIAGDAIPIGARVVAVADSFDAMTTDRPYRRALSTDAAVAELRRVSGTQLDGRLVETFARLIERGQIVPPQPADEDVFFGRKIEHERTTVATA